jgi:hypothetical protein
MPNYNTYNQLSQNSPHINLQRHENQQLQDYINNSTVRITSNRHGEKQDNENRLRQDTERHEAQPPQNYELSGSYIQEITLIGYHKETPGAHNDEEIETSNQHNDQHIKYTKSMEHAINNDQAVNLEKQTTNNKGQWNKQKVTNTSNQGNKKTEENKIESTQPVIGKTET